MSAKCTEEQIQALEAIYDGLDLDGLQLDMIQAIGLDWADDINSAIAHLDFEIRTTMQDTRREAGL